MPVDEGLDGKRMPEVVNPGSASSATTLEPCQRDKITMRLVHVDGYNRVPIVETKKLSDVFPVVTVTEVRVGVQRLERRLVQGHLACLFAL